MTTRRQIISLILNVFLVSSCSLLSSDTPQRIVRVKILADVPFRARNPRWNDEARGLIEAASDFYEREFAVRIVTQSVAPWPADERIDSTPNLLAKMRQEFPLRTRNSDYDLVVAFTAANVSRYVVAGRPRVDRIGSCAEGLGSYVVVPVQNIFRYTGAAAEPETDVVSLIHELGHIFGAEHVDNIDSIMHENFGYRTQFDAGNRAVIEKNKSCPFAN